LQADLPFIPFYLFGPVAILALYVCFHLYLQRLWDGAAQLPAVFQDGRTLDSCLPWFAKWPAHLHCKWLKKHERPWLFLRPESQSSFVLDYAGHDTSFLGAIPHAAGPARIYSSLLCLPRHPRLQR